MLIYNVVEIKCTIIISLLSSLCIRRNICIAGFLTDDTLPCVLILSSCGCQPVLSYSPENSRSAKVLNHKTNKLTSCMQDGLLMVCTFDRMVIKCDRLSKKPTCLHKHAY